ncbi:type IV secretory system conjugative DNA transfer family protein, partial [Acinetobacter baumannii]
SESATTGTSDTGGSSPSRSQSSSTTTGTSVTFSSVGRPVLMPDEIRRLSNKHQLLFMREMPVVLARRTPYFETFGRFLPRHTLVDVLRSTKLLGQQQRALVPYGPAEFNRESPLIE